VSASILLVLLLPLQLAGILSGPVTGYIWLPILVFEIVFALWLLLRGVASPGQQGSTITVGAAT
jgi:hypothetical protein